MSDEKKKKKSLRDQAKTVRYPNSWDYPLHFMRNPQCSASDVVQRDLKRTHDELKKFLEERGLNVRIQVPTHDQVFIDVPEADAAKAKEALDCYFCDLIGPPVTRFFIDKDRVDSALQAAEQWCMDGLLKEHGLTMEAFRALPKREQYEIIYGGKDAAGKVTSSTAERNDQAVREEDDPTGAG